MSTLIGLFFLFLLALSFHTYSLYRGKPGLLPFSSRLAHRRFSPPNTRRQHPPRISTTPRSSAHSTSIGVDSDNEIGQVAHAHRISLSVASASTRGSPNSSPGVGHCQGQFGLGVSRFSDSLGADLRPAVRRTSQFEFASFVSQAFTDELLSLYGESDQLQASDARRSARLEPSDITLVVSPPTPPRTTRYTASVSSYSSDAHSVSSSRFIGHSEIPEIPNENMSIQSKFVDTRRPLTLDDLVVNERPLHVPEVSPDSVNFTSIIYSTSPTLVSKGSIQPRLSLAAVNPTQDRVPQVPQFGYGSTITRPEGIVMDRGARPSVTRVYSLLPAPYAAKPDARSPVEKTSMSTLRPIGRIQIDTPQKPESALSRPDLPGSPPQIVHEQRLVIRPEPIGRVSPTLRNVDVDGQYSYPSLPQAIRDPSRRHTRSSAAVSMYMLVGNMLAGTPAAPPRSYFSPPQSPIPVEDSRWANMLARSTNAAETSLKRMWKAAFGPRSVDERGRSETTSDSPRSISKRIGVKKIQDARRLKDNSRLGNEWPGAYGADSVGAAATKRRRKELGEEMNYDVGELASAGGGERHSGYGYSSSGRDSGASRLMLSDFPIPPDGLPPNSPPEASRSPLDAHDGVQTDGVDRRLVCFGSPTQPDAGCRFSFDGEPPVPLFADGLFGPRSDSSAFFLGEDEVTIAKDPDDRLRRDTFGNRPELT
ncbi:hypothetical protein FRB99_006871 [Tulasnella sp. 403]|nr:hypothetical protein FRB99_006871 [Tulasnella sp. 403]